MKKRAAAIVLAAGLMAGMPSAYATTTAAPQGHRHCALPVFGPGAAYHPTIRPAGFGPHVTNPYFPLRPGTTYLYAGTKDGKSAVDIVTPSRRTRLVDGVRTRVVEDRLFLDGVLEERTSDYYAQDRCGSVWYFGEDTAELDRFGHVTSREGAFFTRALLERSRELSCRRIRRWVGGSVKSGRPARRRTSSGWCPRRPRSPCLPAATAMRCAPRRPPPSSWGAGRQGLRPGRRRGRGGGGPWTRREAGPGRGTRW